MKQKILTYFYTLTGDEYVFPIEKDIEEQINDGWRAVSVAQSVFQTKKRTLHGELMDFNELSVSVLYEKDE